MKIKEKLLALLKKLRGTGAPAVYYEQQARVGLCKCGEDTEAEVESEDEAAAENWHGFRVTIPVFDIAAALGAWCLLCKLFRRRK